MTRDGKYFWDHVLTLEDGYRLLECCIGEDSEVVCKISRKRCCELLAMSVMGQVRREEACMLHIGHPWFLILQLEGGSLRKWSMASTYIALLSTGSIFTDSLILSLVFPGDWIWNSRRIGNSYVKFHCRLHIGIETALKVWRQGSYLPKNNWSCFSPYTIIQQVLNIGLKVGGRGNQERNGSEKQCLMAKMSLHRTPEDTSPHMWI